MGGDELPVDRRSDPHATVVAEKTYPHAGRPLHLWHPEGHILQVIPFKGKDSEIWSREVGQDHGRHPVGCPKLVDPTRRSEEHGDRAKVGEQNGRRLEELDRFVGHFETLLHSVVSHRDHEEAERPKI